MPPHQVVTLRQLHPRLLLLAPRLDDLAPRPRERQLGIEESISSAHTLPLEHQDLLDVLPHGSGGGTRRPERQLGGEAVRVLEWSRGVGVVEPLDQGLE